jgi:emp24/gp25L/p24 family/GOLD
MQLADPDDSLLGKQIRQSTGTLSITAEKDGRHEYCFSNQMSSIADKIVRYVYLNTLQCVDNIYHALGQVSMFTVSFLLPRMVRSRDTLYWSDYLNSSTPQMSSHPSNAKFEPLRTDWQPLETNRSTSFCGNGHIEIQPNRRILE